MLFHCQIPLEECWVTCGVEDRRCTFVISVLRATTCKILNTTTCSNIMAPVELVEERDVGKGRVLSRKDPGIG